MLSRDQILERMAGLDLVLLERAWEFVIRKQDAKPAMRHRHELERRVKAFKAVQPIPSKQDWYKLAAYLKKVLPYSKSTSIGQIASILEGIDKRLSKNERK